MTKKQLRQRLEDLYCGANYGCRRDDEELEAHIMGSLGPERFGQFLLAIENTFDLNRDDHGQPNATKRHNLDEYTTMDNLTTFILGQLK